MSRLMQNMTPTWKGKQENGLKPSQEKELDLTLLKDSRVA